MATMDTVLLARARRLVENFLRQGPIPVSMLPALVERLPGEGLHDRRALLAAIDSLLGEGLVEHRPGGLLCAAWRGGGLVDVAERQRIGRLGELFVVGESQRRLCAAGHPDLARRVDHIALVDDSVGYDVLCPIPGGQRLLEIKTTTARTAALEVHISRNEAEVAAARPEWRLVVVVLDGQTPAIAGSFRFADFADRLAVDPPTGGRWADTLVAVPQATENCWLAA